MSPRAFRADPSEIVADGGDLMRLANDILTQGAGLNYLLNISQDQIGGISAGAAVAEFVNPVTRSTLKLTVHPWIPGHCPAHELPVAPDVVARRQRVGDDAACRTTCPLR